MKVLKCYKNKITLIALFILLAGCQTPHPYDYTNLLNSQPKSIVVIPPINNSVEVNAPYIFLSTISKPLAEKGYYVFPVSVIDHFLKENGLPTPDEMNTVPLDKIRKFIGADAVLYTNINNWGQKYQVISSTAIVTSTLKLVDTRTGDLLWETTAEASRESGDGGGGLLGAIAAAVTEQIIGSLHDQTPQLSRLANQNAINHPQRGLLDDPYRKTSL
ncbi:hypothetical protein AB835_02235 [Candidatus Endobugula sertula]|uniref:Lipoprotein n=1 Tax=Candidatus Endobugula sertula TaxID=62101 RepID=A0A1D2QT61_9GAMM|nr:hypothetical protein AB835_02235 [Candidatus Endobugula sertula]